MGIKRSVWAAKKCPHCNGNKLTIDKSELTGVRMRCVNCHKTSSWKDWIPDAIREFMGMSDEYQDHGR